MNTQDYESQFPSESLPPADAIGTIVERFPRWMKWSLFRERDFVQLFAKRIIRILWKLPEDRESRKLLEVEIAYIMHTVYTKYGIVISQDSLDASLRVIEYQLARENLLTSYARFSKGESAEVDISEPKYMELYLEYLYGYAFKDIQHAYVYIDTCVRLSQLEGGSDILHSHLDLLYAHIRDEDIDCMLIVNDYLWWTDVADHILGIQEEELHQSWEVLTDLQALFLLREEQRTCAKFHIFLNHIVRKAITAGIDSLSAEHRKKLLNRLNDFRDIIDPEMYISVSFNSGNTLEQTARMKWEADGRELH